MSMNRLIIKGGYGEHGRSCFLMPYRETKYFMLDCGIMDTDPSPWPKVEPELLKRTEYLILSHCHKDHSGAFKELCRQGFHGWLVTTAPTLDLTGISYDRIIVLEEPDGSGNQTCPLPGGLSVTYGRSGHCVGSIWLQVSWEGGSLFYSGDYQSRPLAYAVDLIAGRSGELAIIDCAHAGSEEDADGLRLLLAERIRRLTAEGHKVILPLPKYGRGLEFICMLRDSLPDISVGADPVFTSTTERMLQYPGWLKPESIGTIQDFLETDPGKLLERGDCQVILLGDTHLERPENSRLAMEETKKGAFVLLTGRVKKGCATETLLNEGKAFVMSYPHHQSRSDFLETVKNNRFHVILPFHNNLKEIFWG